MGSLSTHSYSLASLEIELIRGRGRIVKCSSGEQFSMMQILEVFLTYRYYSPSGTFFHTIRDDFSINDFTQKVEKFLQFSRLDSVAHVTNKHFTFT